MLNSDANIWQEALLPIHSTIQQAISNLDQVAIKIVLVINEKDELLGTISDGDIRRALLNGVGLNEPITNVIHRNALVVPPEMSRDMVKQLMIANKIQQIPVVNDFHHVVGIHLWDEIESPPLRNHSMVIMAGGKGTRLLPHTENCPKPMLRVAGRPMLEHIIERAKAEGFGHFILAIHYLGQMIEDYFGNGKGMGVKIDYLKESTPLGTAGALSLINPLPDQPFVVTNGDVLTDIQYGKLLDFHLRYNATATMAVRMHEWQHPFGVVQTEGIKVIGFEEKPISRSHINAGVYVLNPASLCALSQNSYCDMPTLFERLHAKSMLTLAYPMHEPWLDVGRPEDLIRANDEN